MLCLGMVVAACGGTGGVDDQPASTAAGANAPAGQAASSPVAPGEASNDPLADAATGDLAPDLCSTAPAEHAYLVEIGLLDEEDLAGLPVPYDQHSEGYWDLGNLGSDGAYAVGEGLIDAWICDLEVTPEVIALFERLSDEPGSEIPIEQIMEIVTGGSESDAGSLDVLSPGDLMQLARDFIYAAGLAEQVGNLDRSAAFKDQAADVFGAYAEIMLNDTTDVAVLMDTMAMAQLLGLDELSDDLSTRIGELLEKKLSDAATLFNPCTTDPNIVRIYVEALKRARIWDQLAGDGRFETWIDVQERRAQGEPVPECEGAIFAEVVPLEGWDGTLDVMLSTCGFTRWTGRVTASGTLTEAGGKMTLQGTIPLEIFFDDPEDNEGVGDFAGTMEITLETPEAAGSGGTYLTGRAFFTWTGSEWVLELYFDAGTFDLTIEANGMTISQSRPIDWDTATFTGPPDKFDSACAD